MGDIGAPLTMTASSGVPIAEGNASSLELILPGHTSIRG